MSVCMSTYDVSWYVYLELCLGLVDVDNELVSLLLKIRSLQPHHITAHTAMNACTHIV